MQELKKGSFFGINKRTAEYNGLIIADTEFTPTQIPWHYHENPYFTYFMTGHLSEVNKKNSYECLPGSIVFHNHQEPHYNTRHSEYMHYFHTELDKKWFERHQLDLSSFEGSKFLNNSEYRNLFNRIYKEFLINDSASSIAIEGLALQVFGTMKRNTGGITKALPSWVEKIKEMINDRYSEQLSLQMFSMHLGISTVYLSQAFPKYFGINFGEYIRKVRVEKARILLSDKHLSLAQVTYDCGFSDQSHFTRCFRSIYGITPSHYRKNVLGH